MVLLIILALLLVFILVVLYKAYMFKPLTQKDVEHTALDFDGEATVKSLQELIRCKTISYDDHSLEDDSEFTKLIEKLPELFPEVERVCKKIDIEDRALFYKWEGKEHSQPSVMMAHYDVVPIEEDKWTKPPFDAVIEDGIMYGRGVVDTKITFNAVLSAVNHLIEKGFVPQQDIYLAFSGGEEVNGLGAPNIVDWFENNAITPALVVDEGGAVVKGIFPGVKEPCALIGIAEKGLVNLNLHVNTSGGHASTPQPHTPIGVLSKACCNVENHPFAMHITKPVEEMFDTLGRRSTFLYRILFGNMWCFKGVINLICKKSGGALNALVRTTVAFTQAQGSKAPNVIPPVASMTANLRLNPEDTVDSALNYIKQTIADDQVTYSLGENTNPSRISQTKCEAWDKVEKAVLSTWRGCLVSPYLMVACSDSRHYGRISDKVYRFSACDLEDDERNSIHGNDEHIRVDVIKRAMEFYIRLLKSC